jgi:hypothetical protein
VFDFGISDRGTNANGIGTNYVIFTTARGGSEVPGFEETTVNPFGNAVDPESLVLTGPGPMPIGQEVYIAITYDPLGGSNKLYLNGVLAACQNADGLVMAAAVADFRVKHVAEHKLKKQDGVPQIELEAAPDVLGTVAKMRVDLKRVKVVVGFAAESRELVENAAAKLTSKKLDFIAANDISASDAGFAVDTNRITLLYADGRRESLPLLEKHEVADAIIERVAALLEK